jgi:hypothetical protein
VSGGEATVTVTGLGAAEECERMVGADAGQPGSYYRYPDDEVPTAPVVCSVTSPSGRTYTVRDDGLLKLYGTTICESLSAPSPTFSG